MAEAFSSESARMAWLKVYGEAIYGTRVCEPYSSGAVQFTQKDDTTYAIYLYRNEQEVVPEELFIPIQTAFSRIDLVGGQEGLEYRRTDEGVVVRLPDQERQEAAPIAHVLRFRIAICDLHIAR